MTVTVTETIYSVAITESGGGSQVTIATGSITETDPIASAALTSHTTTHPVPTTRDTRNAESSKGVTNGDSHDHSGGDGAAIPAASITDFASTARAAAGSLPVVALGTLSGATAIDWSGEGQVVTATVDNVAYEFTEGTGWPVANLADVCLLLTVTTPAAGTWTIVSAGKWFNPPASFAAGLHLLVLRKVGGTMHAIYGGLAEALA